MISRKYILQILKIINIDDSENVTLKNSENVTLIFVS